MPKKIATKVIKSVSQNLTPMHWAVWIFPLFALIIAGWLAIDYYVQRGPVITITFEDASNVEPEKTSLQYRGIKVGKVESVMLAENTKNVIVKARLSREAKHLAVEGSKFWVVVPKVDFAGVSGLETIFKGPYIRVEPGKGKFITEFKGDAGDEVQDPTTGTIAYFVSTHLADSLNPGDPVTYRGLKVGSVTAATLGSRAREVKLQINIDKEYVRLVRTNTVFWRKVGVKVDAGLFGAEVKINSMETLLKGGIALATPPEAGAIANAESKFDLQDEPPKKWEEWEPKL